MAKVKKVKTIVSENKSEIQVPSIKKEIPIVRIIDFKNPKADKKGFVSVKLNELSDKQIIELNEHYVKQYYLLQLKLDRNIFLSDLYATEAEERNLKLETIENTFIFDKDKCVSY